MHFIWRSGTHVQNFIFIIRSSPKDKELYKSNSNGNMNSHAKVKKGQKHIKRKTCNLNSWKCHDFVTCESKREKAIIILRVHVDHAFIWWHKKFYLMYIYQVVGDPCMMHIVPFPALHCTLGIWWSHSHFIYLI